jgi:mannose-6-phosphate isomerase
MEASLYLAGTAPLLAIAAAFWMIGKHMSNVSSLSGPIRFNPLPMERVWGGRHFQTLLGKHLPQGVIGELWEIVDRPEAQSIVSEGPLKGKTLHDLWTSARREVFGVHHLGNPSPRFPLLVKLLDARERLSVQVHPPAHRAQELQGEPKTECWYFLDAGEKATVYAGLRKGVTEQDFEKALASGTVEETLHEAPVRTGESIFIPSGRLHAIGEDLLIVEVQQNSDTTYRVFDWNRMGLDGKPRDLHREHSMASIDFDDFEPAITPASQPTVADCPYFHVSTITISEPHDLARPGDFAIVTGLTGEAVCEGVKILPGEFLLIPSCLAKAMLHPLSKSTAVMVTRLPASA